MKVERRCVGRQRRRQFVGQWLYLRFGFLVPFIATLRRSLPATENAGPRQQAEHP